jgi:hypothetical protein
MAADPANHRQEFHVTVVRKIPLDKSASHRVATKASAAQIEEWNRVYQAKSSAQRSPLL